MKIAIIAINHKGRELADRLKKGFSDAAIISPKKKDYESVGTLPDIMGELFKAYDGIIFIAALGIVVRLISPHLKAKYTDPAIVAVDTAGRFAISTLSGHEGGANDLAYSVAAAIDAVPVITTGTESQKSIVLGIGCRRNIRTDSVKSAILTSLGHCHLSLDEVRIAATIDIKKNEIGLTDSCIELGLPLVFIPRDTIKNFVSDGSSSIAKRNIGVDGVCEPCAIIAGRRAKLIQKKRVIDGVTIAIARENLA